ncbi:MAG: hypothetical protein K0S76_1138 [Herbinix sp.]|jgi:trigger factor|nr:hypothetical protein [Herbinix sp.]
MKKRALLLVAGLCIAMLAGGCNTKKDLNQDSNNDVTDDGADNGADNGTETPDTGTDIATPEKGEYKLEDYIKLGQYKDIEITKVEVAEVTDEDVTAAIDGVLGENPNYEEITDRTDVQNGDVVNIDYEGLKDGVAFDGGTATDANLTIGSGSFIPGFEEQLIGKKVGEKVDLNLTFPEDYSNSAELAGQAVVFKVTVNKILKVNPELTDTYVKSNFDVDTVDAYKVNLRNELKLTNETNAKNEKTNNVLNKIIENSEITHPQTLLDYYSAQMKNYYTEYASYFGMDIASFLGMSGVTEEDFNNDVKSYSETMSSQELVIKAIIEAEKMGISDAEYQEGASELAEEYGYTSSEEFLQTAKEEDVKESLLWQKVLDFITAEANEI